MKSVIRNALITFSSSSSSSSSSSLSNCFLNPNSHFPLISSAFRTLPKLAVSSSLLCTSPSPFRSLCSASMAEGEPHSLSLEKQFESFRTELDESGGLRERIRAVVMEIDSTARLIHAGLLLVHQARPTPEVLEKPKSQIAVLKELYNRLAQIIHESPAQYYRYHGDWRSETQNVVSMLAFMHWLETGNLLLHSEAQEILGLNNLEFGLDTEDYLVGICFMSNELPRFVVNQVTAGDYDCPRKVLKFMTELNAAFRMLNLRNDFLRKKFDGMKYDLRKVEEVHYDVKIRGLTVTDSSAQKKIDREEPLAE